MPTALTGNPYALSEPMRRVLASLSSQVVIGTLAFGDPRSWTVPVLLSSLVVASLASALTARWALNAPRRWCVFGLASWLVLSLSAWYDIAIGVGATTLVIAGHRAALWAWLFGGAIPTMLITRGPHRLPVAAALALATLLALIAGSVVGFSGYRADLTILVAGASSAAPAAFVLIPLGASVLLLSGHQRRGRAR